jgi:hypothetical protein
MSWVRLDDSAPEHPKFLKLAELAKQGDRGAAAAWLWVCGLAYCNRQPSRNGFIPRAKIPQLYPVKGAAGLAARLVEVGLWESREDGFAIHDYHDYQPSAADAADLSDKRSEAGRKGGKRSGESRASKPRDGRVDAESEPSPSRMQAESEPHASRVDDATDEIPEGNQQTSEASCLKQTNPRPVPSRPNPDQPPNPLSGGTLPLGLPAGEPETGAAGGEEAREGTKQAASRKAAKPRKPKAADVLVEKHRETIAAVLDLLDAARGKLVEPDPDRAGHHRPCPLPPVKRDNPENWRTIAARIEEGATVEQSHHVLGVRFAAIRAGDPSREYFNAINPFASEWFARYLETDAAAAAARVRADLERRAPRPSRLAPGNAKPTKSEAEIIAAQERDLDRRREERRAADLAAMDPTERARIEAEVAEMMARHARAAGAA